MALSEAQAGGVCQALVRDAEWGGIGAVAKVGAQAPLPPEAATDTVKATASAGLRWRRKPVPSF